MRKLLIALVVIGIIAYVAWRYVNTESRAARAKTGGGAVAVEIARIVRRDLTDRAQFTGSIRAAERYDAASKIAGILKVVNIDIGDQVAKGDIIAVLDDDEHSLLVSQAEASLTVARAEANDAERQLEIAKRDFDRSAALYKQNVTTAQEYDRAEASYKALEAKHETALAQIKLSQALLDAARVRRGYTRVVADWPGNGAKRIVGQRYVDSGALVAANQPILSILDINTVKAVISVTEKEYPKLSVGYPVTIHTDAFPGRAFKGSVARIAQEMNDLTREAEIEIHINNADHALKPGMYIRADIEFATHKNAVACPVEALVRDSRGEFGVYLADPETKKAAFHSIVQGITDGGWVELVNGDDMRDKLAVVMGQHLLKDGIDVIIAAGQDSEGDE